jgi:hypothetical protein
MVHELCRCRCTGWSLCRGWSLRDRCSADIPNRCAHVTRDLPGLCPHPSWFVPAPSWLCARTLLALCSHKCGLSSRKNTRETAERSPSGRHAGKLARLGDRERPAGCGVERGRRRESAVRPSSWRPDRRCSGPAGVELERHERSPDAARPAGHQGSRGRGHRGRHGLSLTSVAGRPRCPFGFPDRPQTGNTGPGAAAVVRRGNFSTPALSTGVGARGKGG